MKAMFLRRPPRPKYSDTWNPETWLRYLATLGPSSALSLIQLSEKLTALIALETISRLMRKEDITWSNLSQVVKPSYDRPRPNLQGQRHHLQAYRTRETNANRWAWKEFEISLKNKYWGYIYICRDTYMYRYVYIVLTIFPQDINEQRLSAQWTKNRQGSISRRPPRLIFRKQDPYESCTSRRQDDYQVHF